MPDSTSDHVGPSNPQKEVVLEDLKSPWSIAFISDTDALITEKGGNLLRVNLADGSRRIVDGFPLDLANDTAGETRAGGNNGIFDVLPDPGFSINHWVYLAYSAQSGNRIRTVLTTPTVDAVISQIQFIKFTHQRLNYCGFVS
ncbi:MAG: PQQ-dependent sugar dehydrogenase [Lysobacterales bacterium]